MTSAEMTPTPRSNKGAISTDRPKITHYGKIELMPGVTLDGAVLENGERGFIMGQLAQAIGLKAKISAPEIERFCTDLPPNPLTGKGNICPQIVEVTPPGSGRAAKWVHWSALPDMIKGVVRAKIQGTLAPRREKIAARCLVLSEALMGVGVVALIDEATGYQHERGDTALQDLFQKLLAEHSRDWERRFHPEYYRAVCKLFGFAYGNRHRGLPSIVGKITRDWVYDPIFPAEVMDEIKNRQKGELLHQWLNDGGQRLLERQIDAVTTLASCSVDYRDFEARCSVAFYKPGQQVGMVMPARAA
ncbi:MAG: P63C domain-containing protein [Myxococcota bacterium]